MANYLHLLPEPARVLILRIFNDLSSKDLLSFQQVTRKPGGGGAGGRFGHRSIFELPKIPWKLRQGCGRIIVGLAFPTSLLAGVSREE